MNTHTDKTSDTSSNAVANAVTLKQGAEYEGIQLKDDRPETVAQRKIQEAANNSEQANQLKAIQALANGSMQVKQFRAVQAVVNDHTPNSNRHKAIKETVQEKSNPVQRKLQAQADPGENNSGLPDNLKSGVENISGYSLDDVKVHYNSDKPAQLNAHAYAQGTDIHLASGQERHLPHEAWHVVQQKQGRVKPTVQMKGDIAVNDKAELETEADVMGRQAVDIKTLPVVQPKDGITAGHESVASKQDKSEGSLPVVQRLVGFEFETGWYVDFQQPVGFDDMGQIPQPVPFKKKDVVSHTNHDGFRMEADEAEEGRSELEFVVRPPVAESFEGKNRLDAIMTNMEVITGELLAKFGASFSLDEVTGNEYDESTIVTPRDAQMKAGPQTTTAVKLEMIPNILGKGMPEQPPQNPAFYGLAKLIGQYVDRGASEGAPMSYPKIMAEPLLARTDFVGLFALIEPERRQHYIANPDDWVSDVLQAAGLEAGIADRDLLHRGVVSDNDSDEHMRLRLQIHNFRNEPDQHVLDAQVVAATQALQNYQSPQGFKEKILSKLRNDPTLDDLGAIQERLLRDRMILQEEHQQWEDERNQLIQQKQALERHAGFTVRQWLVDILAGNDRITGINDAESMGEFGQRTEAVGQGGDETAGIFEWRGDQTTKIPPGEWRDYALAFMTRILALHGHQEQDGQQ